LTGIKDCGERSFKMSATEFSGVADMQKASRDFILKILDQAVDLTLATIRPDGWPQATTTSYVHDGLTIYIGVGPEGQKAKNVARDKRVSLTFNVPYRSWQEIRGLSMAAEAERVIDPQEMARVGELMTKRFGDQLKDLPATDPSAFCLLRFRPKVISMLDYTKGFGHTDQIEIAPSDLN
jgi:general stress protein 26